MTANIRYASFTYVHKVDVGFNCVGSDAGAADFRIDDAVLTVE